MRCSVALLLPVLALAAPAVEKRADLDSAIVADFQNIVTQLQAVNASVNALPASPNKLSLSQALKLESQTNNLGLALQQTLTDATNTDNLTSAEATSLATTVIGLEAPVKSLIANLIAHAGVFQSQFALGDLSKTIETILTNEQSLVKKLGATLGPKLPAPYNTAAPVVVGQIVAFFTPALNTFATCTGKPCLPPLVFGKGNQAS